MWPVLHITVMINHLIAFTNRFHKHQLHPQIAGKLPDLLQLEQQHVQVLMKRQYKWMLRTTNKSQKCYLLTCSGGLLPFSSLQSIRCLRATSMFQQSEGVLAEHPRSENVLNFHLKVKITFLLPHPRTTTSRVWIRTLSATATTSTTSARLWRTSGWTETPWT